MQGHGKKIREIARHLLAERRVDVVIGFERGTLPLRASPVFVRRPDEVDRLIWDCFCENNLAKYLTRLTDRRVGVVAKGCDSRSIVALMVERQVQREQVTIIGVPCPRMVDRRRIIEEMDGEILHARPKGGSLWLEGKTFKRRLSTIDFLYPSCRVCIHRNPVIHDILVGETVEERSLGEERSLEFEKLPDHERWAIFSKGVSSCIRCYACRQACPMCYCTECFVDNSSPRWIDKGLDPSDLQIWQIVRTFHLTGRCVACGACERACPMDIDLVYMHEKLNREVKERFAFETGIGADAPAPLATFRPDDPEEFVK